MERLLRFFYEYRAFFSFLLLELICAWLIIQNNQYQGAAYFNSSNRLAANIIGFSQGVREYFSLRNINKQLAEENATLRRKLEQRNQSLFSLEMKELKDEAIINRYDYVSAKVVANSTNMLKNYITINKGKDAGIVPGMAAISSAGAVGKVKVVSDHFAVLMSVLNIDHHMSSVIKRTGHFGTIQWNGSDPRLVNLQFIPRHVQPLEGDTVVTSGYNAIFPEGILIGVIKHVTLSEEAPFYDIQVELAQDFGNLSFVEIVKSNLRNEADSLEALTKEPR